MQMLASQSVHVSGMQPKVGGLIPTANVQEIVEHSLSKFLALSVACDAAVALVSVDVGGHICTGRV